MKTDVEKIEEMQCSNCKHVFEGERGFLGRCSKGFMVHEGQQVCANHEEESQ